MTTENSTAAHVANSYASRTKTAAKLLKKRASNNSEKQDRAHERLAELPLSIERKTLVTITLGIGGPADWIDAVCRSEGHELWIESATYTAVWGSDQKVSKLYPGDALYQLAEYYIEAMEA